MSGFADLRTNHDTGHSEESFWPSFTDIMMVIVMIFLISSSVLFLRNWQLVKDLSLTSAAEAEAREEVQLQLSENLALTSEMLSLEEQLAYLEESLTRSRLQNMRVMQQKGALEQQLQQVAKNFRELEGQSRALDVQLQLAQDKNTDLENQSEQQQQQLRAQERELRSAQQAQAQSARRAQVLQQALDDSQDTLAQREQRLQETLAQLQRQQTELQLRSARTEQLSSQLDAALLARDSSATELTDLQTQFSDLESRYKKLVRPARTAKGKYIVSIRHYRDSGGTHYELREDAKDSAFVRMQEHDLDSALAALSAEHGSDLYIRIIFPENSGLNYNQAWAFTQKYLNRYDYYYQDEKVQ